MARVEIVACDVSLNEDGVKIVAEEYDIVIRNKRTGEAKSGVLALCAEHGKSITQIEEWLDKYGTFGGMFEDAPVKQEKEEVVPLAPHASPPVEVKEPLSAPAVQSEPPYLPVGQTETLWEYTQRVKEDLGQNRQDFQRETLGIKDPATYYRIRDGKMIVRKNLQSISTGLKLPYEEIRTLYLIGCNDKQEALTRLKGEESKEE